MNMGQTLITLGMFTLLIMSVISANRMLTENSQAQLQAEALASSSVIASDLIREIMNKPFDQKVVNPQSDTTKLVWRQDSTGKFVTVATSLSTYGGSLWGVRKLVTLPDTSYTGNFKSITSLKDIDDYDGYIRIQRIGNITNDTVKVRVYYVEYSAPDDTTAKATQSFFKKVQITVKQSTYYLNAVYSTMATY